MRNVLESVEREFGAGSVESVAGRVTPRLRPHLSLDRLRASAALDTLPLDEAEEVLLALDSTLGDGSGRALERVAEDLVAKSLVQGGGAVRIGDLYGTVARLRSYLEHPFEEVKVTFELSKHDEGLSLVIGVVGQPRATKVLRHLAAGAIRAAERFARESVGNSLKLTSELFADRARINVQLRSASDSSREDDLTPSFAWRPSQVLRAFTPGALSAQVDKILNPSLEQAERRRSGSVPPPPNSAPGASRKASSPSLPAQRRISSPNVPAQTERDEGQGDKG